MQLQLDLTLPKPPAETTVVIAMSGGVDSSVAAARLVEAGYRVIGLMLRLWVDPLDDIQQAQENRCCTLEAVSDAQRIAEQLAIPFLFVDVSDLFRNQVVEYFIQEYSKARTPNPCLMCNRHVRFDYMLRYAKQHLNADYLATGHYARLQWTSSGVQLLRGVDKRKDQSYVLSMVPQEHLRYLSFPVGDLTKPEVRDLARQYGLQVAEKPESQDLCFTSDYRQFLQRWAQEGVIQPGPILDMSGRELGQHRGLPFYTIGQRKGLGINTKERLYVIKLDRTKNALIVGPAEALGKNRLIAQQINWIQSPPKTPLRVQARIRYKSLDHPATLIPLPNHQADIQFDAPLRDITPGQGIAFYQDQVCLGGGIIEIP